MLQTQYSSALTANTETYCRKSPCGDLIYYYAAIRMYIRTTGRYMITCNSSMDTYGYIYAGSFNPAFPTINRIAEDDNTGGYGQFRFIRAVLSFTELILLVTTFSPNVTGTFTITIMGPESISFTDILMQ
jgi:hypothetical protein